MAPGKSEDVEAAVYDEIAKIQQNGVTTAEFEKADSPAEHDSARQQTLSVAMAGRRRAVAFNDPNLVNERFGKIEAVLSMIKGSEQVSALKQPPLDLHSRNQGPKAQAAKRPPALNRIDGSRPQFADLQPRQ